MAEKCKRQPWRRADDGVNKAVVPGKSAEETVKPLIALIRAGLLQLDQYDVTSFDLDHANEAVAHAAANAGPFKMTVIRPQPGA